MFRGPETDSAKPSSSELNPTLGGSAHLRFQAEEPALSEDFSVVASMTKHQGSWNTVNFPPKRVLKPPGGGSSDPFGCPEEVSSPLKPHRMASNIFGAAEEPQNIPKRTNPPGGKDSGIFGDHRPNPSRQLTNPPGGKTSNIFGSPEPVSTVRAHPNKPKDHIVLCDRGDAPKELKPKAPENQRPQVEDTYEPQKETPKEPGPKTEDHEPRLGPRPRSHNKVLNPPGGKSSIAFY